MNSTAALRVVLCAALAVGCASARCGGPYDPAIERAARNLDRTENATSFRRLLLEGRRLCDRQASLISAEKELSKLHSRREIRLEVGNVNANNCRIAWIVETDSGVTAFSTLFSHDLVRLSISREDWNKTVSVAQEAAQGAQRCGSDLRVDDGSVYFGALALGGATQRFAMYGLILFPQNPKYEDLYRTTKPCSQIVLATYALVKEHSKPGSPW